MRRYIPIVVAVVLGIMGTVAHGIYTERWLPFETDQLKKFTERIPTIPMTLGAWTGTDDPVNPEEFKLTNCTTCIQRSYVNSDRTKAVSIYLVSGTASNICRHSPDWCYRNAGFVQRGPLSNYSVMVEGLDEPVEFCTALFEKTKENSGGTNLRIFWTYAHDGRWRGPTWAKVAFAGRPALYKIYVIIPVSPEKSAVGDTAIDEFAKAAFPIINPILFKTAEASSSL
jgi:Protein of unknown function (DUF3485)